MLVPRQKTPDLEVPTLSHGAFNLATDNAENFTLITFYRGLHCPICTNYLTELELLTPEFEERGVKTIAISSDAEERAQEMGDKIGAEMGDHADSLVQHMGPPWPRWVPSRPLRSPHCSNGGRSCKPRSFRRISPKVFSFIGSE